MQILNRGITWLPSLFSQVVWTPQKWTLESVAVWKIHKKWKRSVWVPGLVFIYFGLVWFTVFAFLLMQIIPDTYGIWDLPKRNKQKCFDSMSLFCSPWWIYYFHFTSKVVLTGWWVELRRALRSSVSQMSDGSALPENKKELAKIPMSLFKKLSGHR